MRKKCSHVLWRVWADIGYCGGPGMVAFAHRPTASLGYPATASYDTFDGANHPFGCWWCGYHP